MPIYTIGYGGRTKQEFLELLLGSGVRAVVDIRLRPDRASMGMWSKAKTPDKGIEKVLNEAGIAYLSLVELGNVFMGAEDWQTPYRQLLDLAGELLTRRLAQAAQPYALLCAEKYARDCHRRILAEYLQRTQGTEIIDLE